MDPPEDRTFLWPSSRNHSTLDIGVLGYIAILQHMKHPPKVWHIPPGTPCICYGVIHCNYAQTQLLYQSSMRVPVKYTKATST
jgi:hypothetical protein